MIRCYTTGGAGEYNGGGANNQYDIYGRPKYDSFTGLFISADERQGGASAQGYGDYRNGSYASSSKTYYGYNYLKKDEGRIERSYFYSQTVYTGTQFVWDNGPPGGGGDWVNPALNFIGGLTIANKGREVLEWEYLRQAKFNRSLSGNFSQPVKHSLRAIKNTGRALGYAGVTLSAVDMAVNGINLSNSLDLVMGGVAFIPGIGWAISGTYFIANISAQLLTNRSIGDHIQGQFTNRNATYKPW